VKRASVTEKKLLRGLEKLKNMADKSASDKSVRLVRDPDRLIGIIWVYQGPKNLGKVWQGMDRKWYNSQKRGFRFRSRKDAVGNLVSGGGSPETRFPVFE